MLNAVVVVGEGIAGVVGRVDVHQADLLSVPGAQECFQHEQVFTCDQHVVLFGVAVTAICFLNEQTWLDLGLR